MCDSSAPLTKAALQLDNTLKAHSLGGKTGRKKNLLSILLCEFRPPEKLPGARKVGCSWENKTKEKQRQTSDITRDINLGCHFSSKSTLIYVTYYPGFIRSSRLSLSCSTGCVESGKEVNLTGGRDPLKRRCICFHPVIRVVFMWLSSVKHTNM